MDDDLQWKMTLDGRRPSMEDGRRSLTEDDLKNEDEHKNEEDLNIEDKSKILKTSNMKTTQN